MLLPGPEAMQLAIYTGWRIHGVVGGLITGSLFVLPGALIMLGLGVVYVTFGTVGLVGAAFLGLRRHCGNCAASLSGLLKITQKHWTMDYRCLWFAGIYIFALPFPLIIGFAALYGFASTAQTPKQHYLISTGFAKSPRNYQNCFHMVCLWWGPLLALDLILGTPLLAQVGYFFSKLAVVTFGGAYAVLAYMAQDVVGQLNWLTLLK